MLWKLSHLGDPPLHFSSSSSLSLDICVDLKNFKFISTLQRNFWIPATMLVSSPKIMSLHSSKIISSSELSDVPWRELSRGKERFRNTDSHNLLHPTPFHWKRGKKDKMLSRTLKIPKDYKRSVLQNIHLYTKKFEGFLISIKIIISSEWWCLLPPHQKPFWLISFQEH